MTETTAICTMIIVYGVLIAVLWLLIGHDNRGGCYRGGHDDCGDEPPEEGSGQ